MRVPRSQITTALFNLLSNAYAFNLATTRAQIPEKIPVGALPAFFLIKPKERIALTPAPVPLPRYTLKYYATIVTRANQVPDDPGSTAENIMDAILDAIDTTLMPTYQGQMLGLMQTLGGLVSNAYIDGDVDIALPVLSPYCFAWIPITVLVGG